MKKVQLLSLFLNAIAICILVIVVVYGDTRYPIINEGNNNLDEIFNINKLLIIPIVIFLYNSFHVIKNSFDKYD